MDSVFLERIRQQYEISKGDLTDLFETILAVARDIGMDRALQYLEQCVIEKRSAWLDINLKRRSTNPLDDGYKLFYERYLGLSVPSDGIIVSSTNHRMVMRWTNPCPTLQACMLLGLDTREICKKAYHEPVQYFLTRIDPRLRFKRNYAALRPYTTYCEEIFELEEPT
jgi:tRNA(adenine34) deaminase